MREIRGILCLATFFAMAIAPVVAPYDSPIALRRYPNFPIAAYAVVCVAFFFCVLVAFVAATSRNRSDDAVRQEYRKVLLASRRATR